MRVKDNVLSVVGTDSLQSIKTVGKKTELKMKIH